MNYVEHTIPKNFKPVEVKQPEYKPVYGKKNLALHNKLNLEAHTPRQQGNCATGYQK